MIDLGSLPAPNVVEALDFESIFSALKGIAIDNAPELADVLVYESEPITKLLQVYAYRELMLRQRINDAARSVMLAYAERSDLDQIGARYGVQRLLIQAANPDAVPPIDAVYESDTAFRRRILLSLEAFTTAGSTASYIYHALSASGDVLDATADSPAPGLVTVYVLSRIGDGTASAELIDMVRAALDGESVRPMTDHVTVMSAGIINYAITAELVVSRGPDSNTVLEAAQKEAEIFAAQAHRMGLDLGISGVYRALHQPGVLQVNLASPVANIVVAIGQATHCTGIALTSSVGDD